MSSHRWPVLALFMCALAAPSLALEPPPVFIQSWPISSGDAWGLAVDLSGDLWVSGNGSSTEKYTNDGQLLATHPFGTHDIACGPDGNLYVVSWEGPNPVIRKVSPSGTELRTWGSRGSGPGQFESPDAIAVGPDGSVFVADSHDDRIQKFSSDGTYLAQWVSQWPGYPWGDGPEYIFGMATDAAGNLYVPHLGGYSPSIHKYSTSGQYLGQWSALLCCQLFGVAIDREDHLYAVMMDASPCLFEYTTSGELLAQWGLPGDGPGELLFPWAIAVDANGHLYATDRHARIHKFGPAPTPANPTTWGGLKALWR